MRSQALTLAAAWRTSNHLPTLIDPQSEEERSVCVESIHSHPGLDKGRPHVQVDCGFRP